MIGSAESSHNAALQGAPVAPGNAARSGTMNALFLLPGRDMRLSTYPVTTLRDVPADAEVVSHQLMLRASLIQTLYSIRSERQLMQHIDYNLLYRWFVGLDIRAIA